MSVKGGVEPDPGGIGPDPAGVRAPSVRPSARQSAARRPRNPHGQGGRLRTDLIAAADRILAQTGDVEALSLRGVAREVGIATPSIYLHFPDKSALVRAVLEERFAQLAAMVGEAVAVAAGPAEQLRAGCLAYCRFATEHPNAYRVLFGRLPPAKPHLQVSDIGPHPPASDVGPHPAAPSPRRRGGDGPLLLPLSAPTWGSAEGEGPQSSWKRGPRGEVRPGGEVARGAGHAVSLPVGAEAFGFLVGGVAACIRAGLAPPADPMRTATAVWTALHGIVSLRASVPQFPWPPLGQQVEDVLHGLVGLPDARHNQMTEGEAVSE